MGAVISTAMLAGCAPMARTPASNGGSAGGVTPPTEPAPTPPETEQSWTLEATHFGDDNAAIWAETSNRSMPFAWDRITVGNLDAVQVSIGGQTLPLRNRAYPPVFESDVSGAEWNLEAEVSPGAVTLVLTAEDQSYHAVKSVTIDAAGRDYTGTPVVEFSAPARGRRATGAVVLTPTGVNSVTVHSGGDTCPGSSRPSVTIGAPQTPGGVRAVGTVVMTPVSRRVSLVHVWSYNQGSGYTATPTVTFGPCPSNAAAARARGAAVLLATSVAAVTVTNGGSGYESPPTVTISSGGGFAATATAVLGRRGNTQADNLYFARRTLYGKELLIRLAGQ